MVKLKVDQGMRRGLIGVVARYLLFGGNAAFTAYSRGNQAQIGANRTHEQLQAVPTPPALQMEPRTKGWAAVRRSARASAFGLAFLTAAWFADWWMTRGFVLTRTAP